MSDLGCPTCCVTYESDGSKHHEPDCLSVEIARLREDLEAAQREQYADVPPLLVIRWEAATQQFVAVVENAGIRDAAGMPVEVVQQYGQGASRAEALRSVLSALTLTISVLAQGRTTPVATKRELDTARELLASPDPGAALRRVVEAAETLAQLLEPSPPYERTAEENALLAALAAWREGKA